MHPLIARLDAALKANYPEFHAALGPGSSQEELDELERVFGLPLPPLYRDFLSWSGPHADAASKVTFSVGNYSLTSARRAIELITMMRSLRLGEPGWSESAWWGEYYLPLLEHGGPEVVIDVAGEARITKGEDSAPYAGSPGQIVEFHHADELRLVQSPDLTTWLMTLAIACERSMYDEDIDDRWAELILEEDEFDRVTTELAPGFPVLLSQIHDPHDFY